MFRIKSDENNFAICISMKITNNSTFVAGKNAVILYWCSKIYTVSQCTRKYGKNFWKKYFYCVSLSVSGLRRILRIRIFRNAGQDRITHQPMIFLCQLISPNFTRTIFRSSYAEMWAKRYKIRPKNPGLICKVDEFCVPE